MPQSDPEWVECGKHEGQQEQICWKWGKGGSIEESDPVWLKSCPLCLAESCEQEADFAAEQGMFSLAQARRVEAKKWRLKAKKAVVKVAGGDC